MHCCMSPDEHIPLDQEMLEELQQLKTSKKYESMGAANITDPIILWWTEFTGEPGKSRSCGQDRCFFTNNRNFRNHKHMKVSFLEFIGSIISHTFIFLIYTSFTFNTLTSNSLMLNSFTSISLTYIISLSFISFTFIYLTFINLSPSL